MSESDPKPTSETPPKQPGSPEPVPGKCGGKLRVRPDDEVSRVGRFCTRPAGWGTPHPGYGTCKLHGGSAPGAIIKATKAIVHDEAKELAGILGEPDPIGDPMVEMFRMAGQVKQWNTVATQKLSELQELDSTDRQGVERIKPIVELWERSADRAMLFYEKLVKLGLMQFKLKIQTEHATLLADIIRGVIHSHELGLTGPQIATAMRLIAEEVDKAGGRLTPEWLTELPDEADDDIYDAEIV